MTVTVTVLAMLLALALIVAVDAVVYRVRYRSHGGGIAGSTDAYIDVAMVNVLILGVLTVLR